MQLLINDETRVVSSWGGAAITSLTVKRRDVIATEECPIGKWGSGGG